MIALVADVQTWRLFFEPITKFVYTDVHYAMSSKNNHQVWSNLGDNGDNYQNILIIIAEQKGD